MALPYEFIAINGERMTPSQVVWQRYKRPYPLILGQFLDMNPELSVPLADSPFIPMGTVVKMPIDERLLAGKPAFQRTVRLSGTR